MSKPLAQFKCSDPVTKRTTEVAIEYINSSGELHSYNYQRVSYSTEHGANCDRVVERDFDFDTAFTEKYRVLERAKQCAVLVHDLLTL